MTLREIVCIIAGHRGMTPKLRTYITGDDVAAAERPGFGFEMRWAAALSAATGGSAEPRCHPPASPLRTG